MPLLCTLHQEIRLVKRRRSAYLNLQNAIEKRVSDGTAAEIDWMGHAALELIG